MDFDGLFVVLAVSLMFGCVNPPGDNNSPQGDNVCEDECTPGETRCIGDDSNVYEECIQSDDCAAWEQQAVCTPDQTCSETAGCECNTECELGELNCSDPTDPMRCTTVDGCSIEVMPCVTNCDECHGRACEPACGNQACLVCINATPLQ